MFETREVIAARQRLGSELIKRFAHEGDPCKFCGIIDDDGTGACEKRIACAQTCDCRAVGSSKS